MKHLLSALLLISLATPLWAAEEVKELVKGAVPATHVSVFCVSGYKFTSAAFCGTSGCGITMVQIFDGQGKGVQCR
ncbi:MAG: hypothetical protein RRB13_06370 [bacterium]|nr:hypothetical protein [bacterium]